MCSESKLKKIPDKVLDKIISDLKKLRLIVQDKNKDVHKDQMIIDDFLIGGCK